LSDARGVVINAAVAAVARRARGDSTLAVLPDGVMISYLARVPNSTRIVIGNPVDVAIFGEERMLAAYRANPPDLLAVTGATPRSTATRRLRPGLRARRSALGSPRATSRPSRSKAPGTETSARTLLRRKGYGIPRSSATNDESGANVSSR
jgi:hypothetical protein